jgi:hypothetical protein
LGWADGILIPNLHKALPVGGNCKVTFQSSMKFLTTIFFILSFQFSSGQLKSLGKPRPMTRNEEIADSTNHHCIHQNKLSINERVNKFPFNIANEIRLVSFKSNYGDGLPMKNKKVDLSKLNESVILDKTRLDSLTDILYNTGYKGIFYTFSEGCYIPRNAILFIDTSGQVQAYIELCFQCGDYRLSSKKVNAGQFCTEKYNLLEVFFKTSGIKYGTEVTD